MTQNIPKGGKALGRFPAAVARAKEPGGLADRPGRSSMSARYAGGCLYAGGWKWRLSTFRFQLQTCWFLWRISQDFGTTTCMIAAPRILVAVCREKIAGAKPCR